METPQEDAGKKMGSRALRELKNLTPFAWDTKSKHPPGKATLRDFEKVEEAFLYTGASAKTRGESSKAQSGDGVTPSSVGPLPNRGQTGRRDAGQTGGKNVQQTPGTVQGTLRRAPSGGSTGRKRATPDAMPVPGSSGLGNHHTPAVVSTEQTGGRQGLAAALGFTAGNASLLLGGPPSAGGAVVPMGPPSLGAAADVPASAAGALQQLPPAATPYTTSKRVRISGGGLASSLGLNAGGAVPPPDCTPLPHLRGAPTPQPPRHMLLDPANIPGSLQRANSGHSQGHLGAVASAQKLPLEGSLGKAGTNPLLALGSGRALGSQQQQGRGISGTPAVQHSSTPAGVLPGGLPPMAHALAAALGVDMLTAAAEPAVSNRVVPSPQCQLPTATPLRALSNLQQVSPAQQRSGHAAAGASPAGVTAASHVSVPVPAAAVDPAPRLAAALTLMDVARMAATPSTCRKAPHPGNASILVSRGSLASITEQDPACTPAPAAASRPATANGAAAATPAPGSGNRAAAAPAGGYADAMQGNQDGMTVDLNENRPPPTHVASSSLGGVPSTPRPTPAPPARPSGGNSLGPDPQDPALPSAGAIAHCVVSVVGPDSTAGGSEQQGTLPGGGGCAPAEAAAAAGAGDTGAAIPMEEDPQQDAAQQGVQAGDLGDQGTEAGRDGQPEQQQEQLLQAPVLDPAAVVVAAALAAVVAKAATPASVPRHISKASTSTGSLAMITEEGETEPAGISAQQLLESCQPDTASHGLATSCQDGAAGPTEASLISSRTITAPLVHPAPSGTTTWGVPAGTVITTLPPSVPAPIPQPVLTTLAQPPPKGLGNASPLKLLPRPAVRRTQSRLGGTVTSSTTSNSSVSAAAAAATPAVEAGLQTATASTGHQAVSAGAGAASTGSIPTVPASTGMLPEGALTEGITGITAAAGQAGVTTSQGGPLLPPLALAPPPPGALGASASAPAGTQDLPFPVLHRRTSSNGGGGPGKGKAQGSVTSTLEAGASTGSSTAATTEVVTGKAGKNGSVRQLLRAQLQRQQQAAVLAASATVAAAAAAASGAAASAPAAVSTAPAAAFNTVLAMQLVAAADPAACTALAALPAGAAAAAAGTGFAGLKDACKDAHATSAGNEEDEAMMDAALVLAAVSSSPPLNSLPTTKMGAPAKQSSTQTTVHLKGLAVHASAAGTTGATANPWSASEEGAAGAAGGLQTPVLYSGQYLPPLPAAYQQQHKLPQLQQQQQQHYNLYSASTPGGTTAGNNTAAQMPGLLAAYSKPVPVCNSPGGLASVGDLNASGASSLFMSHTQHPGLVGLTFQEVVKLVSAYCMALDIPPTSENVQQAQQVVSLLRASNTGAALSVLQKLQQQAGHSTKVSASSTGLLTITPLILLDKAPVDQDWCAALRPEVTQVYAALVSSHKALREACQLGNANSNTANTVVNTSSGGPPVPPLNTCSAGVSASGAPGTATASPVLSMTATATAAAAAGVNSAAVSALPAGAAAGAPVTGGGGVQGDPVTCGSPFAAAHQQSAFAVLEPSQGATGTGGAAAEVATAAGAPAGAGSIVYPAHSITATSAGALPSAVQAGNASSLVTPVPSLAPASSVAHSLSATAGLPPRAPTSTTGAQGNTSGFAFGHGKPPLPPSQPSRPQQTTSAFLAAATAGHTNAGPVTPSAFGHASMSLQQQQPPSLAMPANSTASVTPAGHNTSHHAAHPQPLASTASVALTRSSSVNSVNCSVTAAGMLPGASTGSQCATSGNTSGEGTVGGNTLSSNTGTTSTALMSTGSLSRLSVDSAGTFPGFQPGVPAAGASPKPIPHHALLPPQPSVTQNVSQSVSTSSHSLGNLGPLAQALLQAQHAGTTGTSAVQQLVQGAVHSTQQQGLQGIDAFSGASNAALPSMPLSALALASDAVMADLGCAAPTVTTSGVMPMVWETTALPNNTSQAHMQLPCTQAPCLSAAQGPTQLQAQGQGAGGNLCAGNLFGPGGLASAAGGLQLLMLQQLQQQHHTHQHPSHQQNHQNRVQGLALDLSGMPSPAGMVASAAAGIAPGAGGLTATAQGQQQQQQQILLEGAPSLASMLR